MTRIQIRRDTSSNWATYNPVLADGEFALETDTRKLKIGNGEQPYNDLAYQEGESYTLPPATADTLGGIKVGNNLSITEDGVLSATGNVTDAYTKAETDELLDNKQDNLTVLNPLTLQTKAIHTLTGYSYVSGTQNIYANNVYRYTPLSWEDPTLTLGDNWSYIDIPFDIFTQQIITMPLISSSYSYNSSCRFVLGKYDANGNFNPIWAPMYGNPDNGTDQYWATDRIDTPPCNSISAGGSAALNISDKNKTGKAPDKVYLQPYINGGVFAFQGLGCFSESDSPYLMTTTTSNSEYVSRLSQITVCRFLNMGMIQNSSHTVSTADFGRYTTNTFLDDMPFIGGQPDLSEFTNEYVIGEVQTNNYLELNIDNSTIKVNEEGQLYANVTIPDNLVTTNTNQTITAPKIFNPDSTSEIKIGCSDSNYGEVGPYLMVNDSNNAFVITPNTLAMTGPTGGTSQSASALYFSNNNLPTSYADTYPTMDFRAKKSNQDADEATGFSLLLNGNIKTFKGSEEHYVIDTGNQSTLDDSNFNNANQLVRLDSSGKLPALDGSQLTNLPGGSAPTNMVTTDTAQDITAAKTFNNRICVDSIRDTSDKNQVILCNGGYYIRIGSETYTNLQMINLNASVIMIPSGDIRMTSGNRMLQKATTSITIGESGDTIYNGDNQAFVNTNNSTPLTIWRGTQAEYDGITSKDENTLYVITGQGE